MNTKTLDTNLVQAEASKMTSQRMAVYISGLTFAMVLLLAGVVMTMGSSVSGRLGVIEYRLDAMDKRFDGIDKKLDDIGEKLDIIIRTNAK